jgi:hypothetical protein
VEHKKGHTWREFFSNTDPRMFSGGKIEWIFSGIAYRGEVYDFHYLRDGRVEIHVSNSSRMNFGAWESWPTQPPQIDPDSTVVINQNDGSVMFVIVERWKGTLSPRTQ